MKPARLSFASFVLFATSAFAVASDAETWARAGSRRLGRDGTAAAFAHYEGDVGFARTQTRSGKVNLARGVAVGIDESGLSFSISHAVAPRQGPAIASTFNLSIGSDGDVSTSGGLAVADGPLYRSASAGGRLRSEPRPSGSGFSRRYASPATALASGHSDRFGTVRAVTHAEEYKPRGVREVRRYNLWGR